MYLTLIQSNILLKALMLAYIGGSDYIVMCQNSDFFGTKVYIQIDIIEKSMSWRKIKALNNWLQFDITYSTSSTPSCHPQDWAAAAGIPTSI